MTRTYNRSFRAEDAGGTPVPGAQVTLWDDKTGGTQLTDGIQDLSGAPIPGGILVADTWGFVPDFQDTLDRPDIWAVGSLTGTITGVERVLLEASSDDARISALESFTSGAGGLDERLTAVEESRGQADGIATLDADGLVPTAQLPVLPGSAADFNVRDFGAVGDGVTDDAPAIQAALDAVAAGNSGAKVTVPPGTYLIGSELEIKSAVWIELARAATIKRGDPAMQYMIRNFNATFAPTAYGGRRRIRITGGVWDADGGNLTGSVTAIIVAHSKYVRIENVTVQNIRDWHAIELNSTQDAIVRDCSFEGFQVATAGREISEAVQIDLAKDSSVLPGIGAGAYDNTPCDDVLVTGCSARNLSPLGSFGRLCGSHSFTDNVFHTKVRVIGNHAEKLNDFMVRGFNWIDTTVTSNTCTDSNGGVRFEVPTGATVESESIAITGNTFRNMGVQNNGTAVQGAVISIAGLVTPSSVPIREATVTANIIKTFANSSGIATRNVADADVTGNVIKNGTAGSSVGIDMAASANAVVATNKVDTVATGVWMRDNTVNGAGGSAIDNTLISCSTTAVQADAAATSINNNRIRACGNASTASVVINASQALFAGNYVWKNGSGLIALTITASSTDAFVAANFFRGWGTDQASNINSTGATTPTISTTEKYIATA